MIYNNFQWLFLFRSIFCHFRLKLIHLWFLLQYRRIFLKIRWWLAIQNFWLLLITLDNRIRIIFVKLVLLVLFYNFNWLFFTYISPFGLILIFILLLFWQFLKRIFFKKIWWIISHILRLLCITLDTLIRILINNHFNWWFSFTYLWFFFLFLRNFSLYFFLFLRNFYLSFFIWSLILFIFLYFFIFLFFKL